MKTIWTLMCALCFVLALYGCDVPYSGGFGPGDLDRLIEEQGQDTICLADGFDTVCIKTIPGTRGLAGKDGADSQFEISEDGQYIRFGEGDPVIWSEWSKFTGKDGKDGKDGIDGRDGEDGVDGRDGESTTWEGEVPPHTHGTVAGHTHPHAHDLPNHSHDLQEHSHDHVHPITPTTGNGEVPSHDHNFQLPDHTHSHGHALSDHEHDGNSNGEIPHHEHPVGDHEHQHEHNEDVPEHEHQHEHEERIVEVEVPATSHKHYDQDGNQTAGDSHSWDRKNDGRWWHSHYEFNDDTLYHSHSFSHELPE